MQSQEIEVLWQFITGSVDRLVECLDGLQADELNWSPLKNANSLYVLATHMMGNIEQNVQGGICDEPIQRDRDAEFRAKGSSADAIKRRWRELRDRISDCLEDAPDTRLDRKKEHPGRGLITGRERLIIVARHAAEHLGHAELTRDLLKARSDR